MEPGQAFRIISEEIREDFEGYIAPELGIMPAVHLTHAAAADQGGDFIGAEARAWAETSYVFSQENVSGDLTALLSRHHRHVRVLIVRRVACPHHEDDLEPLRTEGTEGSVMAVSTRSLLAIVGQRPLTPAERDERQGVRRVPQVHVARPAKADHVVFPALARDRDHPRLRLQVGHRLPAVWGVAEFGDQGRHDRPLLAARQRSRPAWLRLTCWVRAQRRQTGRGSAVTSAGVGKVRKKARAVGVVISGNSSSGRG